MATPRVVVDHHAALTALRLVLALVVLAAAIIAGVLRRDLVLATALYLALVGVAAVVRRRGPAATRGVASVVAVVDSAYVVAAVVTTGGPTGPLEPVPLLLIAGLAVLSSPRAGLIAALSCASLLALARVANDAEWWTVTVRLDTGDIEFAAVWYVVVALVVGACVAVHDELGRRRNAQVRKLVQLATLFEHAERDDELALALAGHARDVLGFRRAAVAIDVNGGWCAAVAAPTAEETFACIDGPDDAERETWSNETADLVRVLAPGLLTTLLPSARNVVLAPIPAHGAPRGVVAAEWGGRRRSAIPAATVASLGEAVTQTGRAIEVRDRLAAAARLATRDALTGLANRRLFDETVTREVARAVRLGAPLSLIVFDVDGFKAVNDSLGHQVGDHVLQDVGAALIRHTKGSDLAARFGGDEFVVLLPGCSSGDVPAVGERLRRAVAPRRGSAAVTVSGGFATLPDDAIDADGLVAAADAALYRAKRSGRDRLSGPSSVTVRNG